MNLSTLARQLFNQPALLGVKHGIRSLQTLLNYSDFQRVKEITTSLPLAPLLERQPRFVYKYLPRYSVASFTRSERLATLLNHYQFLGTATKPHFFRELHNQPIIWRQDNSNDKLAISLSYPAVAGFECELSLNFLVNSIIVQVVGLVIVPGSLVGAPGEQALLFSQVQGTRQPALLRQATRALHDCTPATLLVQAAYGLAAALNIAHAAGISNQEQLSAGEGSVFDYDAFWAQFQGKRTARGLFLLAIPAPERPISEIKSTNRARHWRKRQFKRQLREAVEQCFRTTFGHSPRPAPEPAEERVMEWAH